MESGRDRDLDPAYTLPYAINVETDCAHGPATSVARLNAQELSPSRLHLG